jgi:hypothetical protein
MDLTQSKVKVENPLAFTEILASTGDYIFSLHETSKKVKKSRYTPWRRLGVEEL